MAKILDAVTTNTTGTLDAAIPEFDKVQVEITGGTVTVTISVSIDGGATYFVVGTSTTSEILVPNGIVRNALVRAATTSIAGATVTVSV